MEAIPWTCLEDDRDAGIAYSGRRAPMSRRCVQGQSRYGAHAPPVAEHATIQYTRTAGTTHCPYPEKGERKRSSALRIDVGGGRVFVKESVDGRQVVVPIVMRRPSVTGRAHGFSPDLAAVRAPALRIEGVPFVFAGTSPPGLGGRLPVTLRTVDLHDADSVVVLWS